MDFTIGKDDVQKNAQFFVTCLHENCTNVFVQLDVDYGNANVRVSESIMFLPVSSWIGSHVEEYYNDICKPQTVRGRLDYNGLPEFCNNFNSSLPYFYVTVDRLKLSNVGGRLKFFNTNNITKGSKCFYYILIFYCTFVNVTPTSVKYFVVIMVIFLRLSN